MKLRRRIGSVFLAFAMALSLIPSVAVSALAATGSDTKAGKYVTLDYGTGSANLKITVNVLYNDEQVDTIVVNNGARSGNNMAVRLNEDKAATYDIENVTINPGGGAQLTNKGDSWDLGIWSVSVTENPDIIINVTLCDQYVAPEIVNKHENWYDLTLEYRLYEPQMLEMLYLNGDKSVNENTEVSNIDVHFVQSYAGSEDKNLNSIPTGANNLPYRTMTLSDVGDKGNPENIRYLEITYNNNDGTGNKTVRIYSGDLRYTGTMVDSRPVYEIEHQNNDKHVVAFYTEPGAQSTTWHLYDLKFVSDNQPLGLENMPEEPTFPATDYIFTNWAEAPDGGEPFLPYENVIEDKTVYAQKTSSEWGGTRYQVMNPDNAMMDRFLEIYNAQAETEYTSEQIDMSSVKIQVNGTDKYDTKGHTNPNYWNNGWLYEGTDQYYRVVNSEINLGWTSETVSNTHIPHDRADSITIFATVSGEKVEVTIPIDNSVPGGVHIGLSSVDNIAQIFVNDPPKPPEEGDIITPPDGLLSEGAVTVDCVNTEIDPEHGDATYGLLEDSFTPPTEDDIQWAAGEGEDDFGYYYIDLVVDSEKYIEEYNKTTSGHELAEGQDETQTIRLICKEFDDTTGKWVWEVETTTPITFQVICETPESGYAITGITKDLVESEDEATAAGIDLDNVPFNFPDENGIVVISASKGSTTSFVNLLYKITVTGKEGAEFTVTDAGAKLVSPEDGTITEQANQIDGNNTFSGTIPEGQTSITFYVSKMFSAEQLESDADSSTGTVLSNTAKITSENVDPDGEDEATEEVDAAEAQTIYTYIQFIGTGVDGALTDEDEAYIKETYGKEVDEWGYLPIGNFDAPLPDPIEEPYAPTGSQGTGGEDFKEQFLDQIKPYITAEGNFYWVDGLTSSQFDLEGGVEWTKLSVANGATSIDNTVTGYCWHLDGRIQLYAPDIDVTKALTEIEHTDGTKTEAADISDDTVLEVGDVLTWTITVTNEGNKEATGLKLEDVLKAGENTIEAGYTIASSSDKDNFSVAAKGEEGDEVIFTATYTVQESDKGLTLSNTATVSDEDGEVPGGEDETENPVANPKVSIEKKLTSATRDKKTVYDSTTGTLTDYKAQVGDVLSYTITVTNEGNTKLTDVKVTDSLWKGGTNLTIKVGTTETTAIADANGSYTPKGVEIAPDATLTITYTYTVTEADALKETISNSVGVYLDSTDPGDEPDGKDDVTVEMDDYTINIAPANITIYTGGTGYAGVLENENGELVSNATASGLPEPGYHIDLPEAVETWLEEHDVDMSAAADLANYLHFRYYDENGEMTRNWDLEDQGVYSMEGDTVTAYVYSLSTNTVEGEFKDTPVRLEFTNNGEIVTDDIVEMDENTASATYQMTIYDGGLDQSQIKAVFTVGDKTITCNVNIGTGNLTVKSVVNKDSVNDIANDGNSVDADTPTAVAGNDVQFYVNDSQVTVDSSRVGLLVDSVSNSDEFNTDMEEDAISEVREDNASLASDAQAQSYYLDLVDTQNGNAVVTMGDNDELTIYWPMPEDADPNGEFRVVHYTEMDRTDMGMQEETPEVKEASVTQDGNHLTFATSSFSPFVLVYEQKDSGTPTPPVTDPDDKPTPPPVDPDDKPQLNTEDHYAYIVGYEDGTVRPEGDITRAEVATIFFRLLTDESRDEYWSQTNDYTDVAEGDWYNNAVSTLSKAGILNGYEDGSFRPNGNITRAEFATIAARFFEATYEGEDLFPDIKGHWARDYINQAAHAGIVNGYEDGTFRPQENITRAEAMTIVNRTLDRHPDADHFLADMITWPDNLESAWYYEQVQEATNSHEYIMKTDADKNPYEIWKEILPVRDWSDLENTWSEAHAG